MASSGYYGITSSDKEFEVMRAGTEFKCSGCVTLADLSDLKLSNEYAKASKYGAIIIHSRRCTCRIETQRLHVAYHRAKNMIPGLMYDEWRTCLQCIHDLHPGILGGDTLHRLIEPPTPEEIAFAREATERAIRSIEQIRTPVEELAEAA